MFKFFYMYIHIEKLKMNDIINIDKIKILDIFKEITKSDFYFIINILFNDNRVIFLKDNYFYVYIDESDIEKIKTFNKNKT